MLATEQSKIPCAKLHGVLGTLLLCEPHWALVRIIRPEPPGPVEAWVTGSGRPAARVPHAPRQCSVGRALA